MLRIIWKNLCERGLKKSLVVDGNKMSEKIAAGFNHVGFGVCELLNIVMLLICFHILYSLLNGKFWS